MNWSKARGMRLHALNEEEMHGWQEPQARRKEPSQRARRATIVLGAVYNITKELELKHNAKVDT